MTTTITPYLSFNGTTREAYAFYEQALGAKILTMMRYGDMPKMEGQSQGCDGAPLVADDIMHACLELPGGAMLFAGDVPPHMMPSGGYDGIKGVMLALQYDTVDAIVPWHPNPDTQGQRNRAFALFDVACVDRRTRRHRSGRRSCLAGHGRGCCKKRSAHGRAQTAREKSGNAVHRARRRKLASMSRPCSVITDSG